MDRLIKIKEYQDFALKLKNIRLEADFTQVEVAKKLKRSQSYISKSEAGEQFCENVCIKNQSRLFCLEW